MNAHTQAVAAGTRSSRPVKPWQERGAIAYPLLLMLAALLVVPANRGAPLLHDSFAIDWVWADQFTRELGRGLLYPRWLPLSDGGLGSPVFYFYPPLAFFLTGVFGLLGFSTYASVIAAFAAAFAASGVGCWQWLKGRSNHPLAAAILFMVAPYHLFDYSVRGALAESVAIAMIPIIAIGLRNIAERRRGIVLTSVAYGAIICTHLPLALLVSILLIGPYALLHRRQLPQFAAAVAMGLGLAAIYLVPALALDRFRDMGQLYRTPNLTTAYWSIAAGNWDNPDYLLIFAIVGALLLAALAAAVGRRDGWSCYAIAIALLVAGAVPFFWSLPLLHYVQFPYRALPLAEFAVATSLAKLPANPGRALLPVAPALLLSLLILPGFQLPGDDLRRLQALHPDVYEYLPKGVMKPRQTSARLADVVAARVPPPKVAGMVVEPHFYFPSWSCGTEEPSTQLLMHDPSCRPRTVWTAAEKIGAAISAIAALMLLLLAVAGRNAASRSPRALLRTQLGKLERGLGDGASGNRSGREGR